MRPGSNTVIDLVSRAGVKMNNVFRESELNISPLDLEVV